MDGNGRVERVGMVRVECPCCSATVREDDLRPGGCHGCSPSADDLAGRFHRARVRRRHRGDDWLPFHFLG